MSNPIEKDMRGKNVCRDFIIIRTQGIFKVVLVNVTLVKKFTFAPLC